MARSFIQPPPNSSGSKLLLYGPFSDTTYAEAILLVDQNGVPIQGSLCPVPPAQGTVIEVVAEVVPPVIDLPVATGPIPIEAAGTADGPPLEVA